MGVAVESAPGEAAVVAVHGRAMTAAPSGVMRNTTRGFTQRGAK